MQQHRQVGLDLALADVFVERPRPEGALDDEVAVVLEVRREDAREVVGHRARIYHSRAPFRTDVRTARPRRRRESHHATRHSGYDAAHAPVPPLRVRPARPRRPGPPRGRRARSPLARWPSATTCRPSSSSRSWRRSSTAGSCARRSGRTAATRWRPTRRRVSIGRVIRLLDGALAPLPCVSLRYYEPCSCPDEATCPLRDVMIDVRDAMLEILDQETLAELAGRQGGPRSTRAAPRRRPGRAAGPEPHGGNSRATAVRRHRATDRKPATARDRQLGEHRAGRIATRVRADGGLASFVGVGRGIWLFPLDTMFRTVGLRYGWLMTAVLPADACAPACTAIGQLRAERAAWRAARRVPAYGQYPDVGGAGRPERPLSRSGSSATCPRRTRRLRRSVRAARALRRRRGPVRRHDDRRIERLDGDALQLDPRQARARGRPPQHRLLRAVRLRHRPARDASTRSRWAHGRPAST